MEIDYSESYLKNILKSVQTIAIVGASSNKDRDSFKVMKNLIENGYKVFPVNPNESGKIILGQECFSDLEVIEEDVDMVDVFRAKEAILGVTKQAIKIGAKVIWMQEGIIHLEAENLAKNAGLKVIMDRCPKKELSKPYWTSETK
tara:strand:+ start:1428 stop:1862 length:435 start_codon:yes stop_codon:yes gene_type:complete